MKLSTAALEEEIGLPLCWMVLILILQLGGSRRTSWMFSPLQLQATALLIHPWGPVLARPLQFQACPSCFLRFVLLYHSKTLRDSGLLLVLEWLGCLARNEPIVLLADDFESNILPNTGKWNEEIALVRGYLSLSVRSTLCHGFLYEVLQTIFEADLESSFSPWTLNPYVLTV